MKRLQENGSVATLGIIVVLALALAGALGFGYWAFSGRADYKDNSDKKVAAAADAAVKAAEVKKDAVFAEKEKSPYKTYNGPVSYGSLALQYPKTWSAFIVEKADNGNTPVDAYFNENFVQDTASKEPFALRIQIATGKYETELTKLETQVKAGKVKLSAYRLPKVPGPLGLKYEGVVNNNGQKQGVMVIVPLRDKILKVWTEGTQWRGDFDNIILANISFAP